MSAAEDREGRLAVESLARRIREARQDPEADADLIAAEFFAILRSRGWRFNEDLAPHRRGTAAGPSSAYRQARALVDAKAAQLVAGEVIPDRPAIEAARIDQPRPEAVAHHREEH